MIFLKLFIVLSVLMCALSVKYTKLRQLQKNHSPKRFNKNDFIEIASQNNMTYMHYTIDKIVRPRVVGTLSHDEVADFIYDQLKSMDFKVDTDNFRNVVPIFGELDFSNVIASYPEDAERFLVLACHYDMKYFKSKPGFMGAIDSGVPCAQLLHLAKTLKPQLEKLKNSPLGLKLIFFDGEEAFEKWDNKDSIYGARHLANLYKDSSSFLRSTNEDVTELERMDMMVLLDLIGHKDCHFYNYFSETKQWFYQLARIEDRLESLKLLKPHSGRYFVRQDILNANIEDDHIPFWWNGVPVLHLIPVPFPKEWHTDDDNRSIIDNDTVHNLNMILRVFVAEYLFGLNK